MPDILPVCLQNILHRGQSDLCNAAEVKLIRADDRYLAFDVNSGSLHELDAVAWELLHRFQGSGDWRQSLTGTAQSYGQEQVGAAAAEVAVLHEAGRLFTPDPGWERYIPDAGPDLKALCFNISDACNMSCGYCFVPRQVRTGREIMPVKVIRAALDFLLSSSTHRHLAVDFFGGEPLLNFSGIRDGVAYALDRGRDRDWKFTLTTNTLLFDEDVISFTAGHNFGLVLSCDGRPEIHDGFRVMPDGRGTADAVARRLQNYLRVAARQEHYIRGTYTRRNLDFTEDVRYLAALGVRSLSLEPVVADAGQSYAIREEDIPGIRKEYLRLARWLREQELAGQKVSFYHYQLDLAGGPCAAKRLTGCGAGYQYLAVTPGGKLYPCHQFVGHPEYCLGDLNRGITRPDLQEQFRQAHIFSKPVCRSCWARFLCGGGCHAQAALQSGDLHHPGPLTCELVQARLEGALYYLALGQSLQENGIDKLASDGVKNPI